jgi:hypothetical protein
MKILMMIMYDAGNDLSSNDYYDCIGRDDNDDNNNNNYNFKRLMHS